MRQGFELIGGGDAALDPGPSLQVRNDTIQSVLS